MAENSSASSHAWKTISRVLEFPHVLLRAISALRIRRTSITNISVLTFFEGSVLADSCPRVLIIYTLYTYIQHDSLLSAKSLFSRPVLLGAKRRGMHWNAGHLPHRPLTKAHAITGLHMDADVFIPSHSFSLTFPKRVKKIVLGMITEFTRGKWGNVSNLPIFYCLLRERY